MPRVPLLLLAVLLSFPSVFVTPASAKTSDFDLTSGQRVADALMSCGGDGAPESRRTVRLASDGLRFVAAWVTSTHTGERVEAASVSAGGGERACYTVREFAQIGGLALASSPEGFLVVWSEEDRIRGALLSAGGSIDLKINIEFSGGHFAGDVEWDGTAFRLVWSDRAFLRHALISTSGKVTRVETLAAGYLDAPRVAVSANGVNAAGSVVVDGRVSIVASSDAGSRTIRELLPPDRVYEPVAIRADVDISSFGGVTVAVVTDGREVELVHLGADGAPVRRTKLAAGAEVGAVAIIPSAGGFAISWLSREWWRNERLPRSHLFTLTIDTDGNPTGPIRRADPGFLPWWRPSSGDAVNSYPPTGVDLASNDLDVIAAWTAWEETNTGGVPLSRVVTAVTSEGEPHPGAPQPPATGSIGVLGAELVSAPHELFYARRWRLEWEPVAGVDGYLVEAEQTTSPGVWKAMNPVSVETEADWMLLESSPRRRFRVMSVRNGLLSEPLVVEFSRRRLMSR